MRIPAITLAIALSAIAIMPGAATAAPQLSAAAQKDLKEAEQLEEKVASLFRATKYDEAQKLAEKRIAILERVRGKDHKDTANAVNDLAALLHAKSDLKGAEALFLRSLTALEKAVGPDDPDTAVTRQNLARVYLDLGDLNRAEPLFMRALAAYEKAYGPDDPQLASVLTNLGSLLQTKGDLGRAEAMYGRVIQIFEKSPTANLTDRARAIHQLALVYDEENDFSRADPLHQLAVVTMEKAVGKQHPALAPYLNAYGLMHKLRGDYAAAEPLYLRSLAILERSVKPDSPRLSSVLGNLGSLYKARGDYTRAEPLLARALAINESALGPDHPSTIDIVSMLGLLYRARHDYARAEPLLARVLASREKKFGPDHASVADALNNLSHIYNLQGDLTRAEALVLRAIAIYEKALGPEHPKTSTAKSSLANIARAKGDIDRAEALYREALATTEKRLGPDHPPVAISLENLGVILVERRHYDEAEGLFRRAYEIQSKTAGEASPAAAGALANLAATRAARGDRKGALAALDRATEIRDRNAALVLSAGSEEQRRSFMDEIRRETFQVIQLAVSAGGRDAAANKLAARSILRRKGRVLDAAANSVAALRDRLDPADRVLLDELSKARAELAQRTFGGAPASETPEVRREKARALEGTIERLDAEITARSADYRQSAPMIMVSDVASALPDDGALVELFIYQQFDFNAPIASRWSAPRYAAVVLRKKGDPAFVDVGPAAAIDAAVNDLRRAISSPSGDPKPAGRKLDALVMEPLRPLLGDARSISMSPDGALNLIPFGALVGPDGEYLVRRYLFTYLTSGRDLLQRHHDAKTDQSIVVVANPDFGERSKKPSDGGATRAEGDDKSDDKGGDKDDDDRSTLGRGIRFPPLPGTAVEAEKIGSMMRGARVLSGALATEDEVKKVRRPRILHIATHGFFLPGATLEAMAGTRGLVLEGASADTDAAEPLSAPLLRSGLAFASANYRPSKGDDGVLTALEAAGLDLYGTKLVVLSACETGLGEAKDGEGVYGLRRALVLAGAETEVMSLWKVSDEGTQRLMVSYYDHLLAGGGRSAALRDVQLAMLSDTTVAHPYYWASFVVSGSGEPLDGLGARPVKEAIRAPKGANGCACSLPGLRNASDDAPSLPLSALVSIALGGALAARRDRRAPRRAKRARPR